jgi:hypothetical protein
MFIHLYHKDNRLEWMVWLRDDISLCQYLISKAFGYNIESQNTKAVLLRSIIDITNLEDLKLALRTIYKNVKIIYLEDKS